MHSIRSRKKTWLVAAGLLPFAAGAASAQDAEKAKQAETTTETVTVGRAKIQAEAEAQAARVEAQAARAGAQAARAQAEADAGRAAAERVRSRLTQTRPEYHLIPGQFDGAPFRAVRGFGMASSRSGVELAEVSDAIRAQVDIPERQGVLVLQVRKGSQADTAGIAVNDILLSVDRKPVRDVRLARALLDQKRDGKVEVKVVRGGEPKTLDYAGPGEETEKAFAEFRGPITIRQNSYWIGVTASPIDDALRSHLTKLDAGAGVIVNDVLKDSPAAKAKVQKNDVLISVDGQPLKGQNELADLVQKSGGEPVQIKLLRAGKPKDVTVTPEKKNVLTLNQVAGPMRIRVDVNDAQTFPFHALPDRPDPGEAAQAYTKLREVITRTEDASTRRIEAELKELNRKLDDLRKAVDESIKAELQKARKDVDKAIKDAKDEASKNDNDD